MTELTARTDALLRANGGRQEADAAARLFSAPRLTNGAALQALLTAVHAADAALLDAEDTAAKVDDLEAAAYLDPSVLSWDAVSLAVQGWRDSLANAELWRQTANAEAVQAANALTDADAAGVPLPETVDLAYRASLRLFLVARLIQVATSEAVGNVEDATEGFSILEFFDALKRQLSAVLTTAVQALAKLVEAVVGGVARGLPWWLWLTGGVALVGGVGYVVVQARRAA